MKIGIDCRLWSQSGVGRYIRNLVKNLAILDSKNKYVLFSNPKDIDSIKGIIKGNFEIVKADVKWHSFKEQIVFKSIIEKEKLDLMHFPYFSIPAFYNKPFVITIHDLIIDHFSTGKASTLPYSIYKLKYFGYKFLTKLASKNARKIITVSNSTKEEIKDHLGIKDSKISVIYEGVDENITKGNLDNKFGKYFLYVGNAYPHKNLETLIKAFNLFSKNNKDFKLVLVGKEDYFYKKLKINLEKNIVIYGNATDKELSSLYKEAKALVMPSLMEGFGLPIIEAFSNKCLVLCSDIAIFHEIAKDNAIYFNPSSSEDIKEKMQLVMNKEFNKKIEDGFKIAGTFNWSKTAKETLKIYEDCNSLR